jgi:hypothetical protein
MIDWIADFRTAQSAYVGHFAMETLAMVVGFRYFLWLRKRQDDPITEPNRIIILIAAAAGAWCLWFFRPLC